MPKPPPTSPTVTRTWSRDRPRMSLHSELRTPLGIWLLMRSVRRPSSAIHASTERGSMVSAATRWLVMASLTTCAAAANASAVAASLPWRISAAMLSDASGHKAGAPAVVASVKPTTCGSSSYSAYTASAASRACCMVSATTMATASPTWRTRSCASTRRSGVAPGAPPARLKLALPGMGLTPAAARSAPVYTPTTPGMSLAALVSTDTMRACG